MIIFLSFFQNISSLKETNDLIVNDNFWRDTNGNFIFSQGGGVFKFGDTFYWYGVHYKGAEAYAYSPGQRNSDTSFVSITCYSSKDLVNWKFENDVLTPKSKGWVQAGWVGRMGVAYCPKTKLYVLVTQHDDNVLFATSSTPNGNFEVKNRQHQIQNVDNIRVSLGWYLIFFVISLSLSSLIALVIRTRYLRFIKGQF